MKRIAGLILALILVLSLFACQKNEDVSVSSVPETVTSGVENPGDILTDITESVEGALSSSLDPAAGVVEAPVYAPYGDPNTTAAAPDGGEEPAADPYVEEPEISDEPQSGEEPETPEYPEDDPENTEPVIDDQGADPEIGEEPAIAAIETEAPTELAAPTETPTESKDVIESFMASNGKLYLIISLVVLVVLLAVIIGLLVKRKSSDKPRPKPSDDSGDDLIPTEEDDTMINSTTADLSPDSASSLPVRAASAHNIGRRRIQEDSFGVSDLKNSALYRLKGAMAVVADGMGGLKGGDNVSSLAVLTMLQSFSDMQYQNTGEEELNRLLNKAVFEVNRYLESTVGLKKSGSTLMAVIIHGGMLSWVSVGDSRTALFRNGKLTDLNSRHNYGAELDEMVRNNRISAEQAKNHPDREKLTSYLGMGKLKYVDRSARPMPLQKGDRILLMSDGIFNTLTDPEIEQILRLPIELVGAQMEERVLKKANPHQDNFTAVVLEYSGG